ncbi:hypothetical protein Tsubulata_012385 [Turnera subulata]|uniref:S1 motif domain-containing protein n=1 Tax=Turnera subulata TaxID=218843 RepID=A0A9Q0FVR8_9ROSI|nr:hypothetical protein Tsubulata_012385 [Turnera subulata]
MDGLTLATTATSSYVSCRNINKFSFRPVLSPRVKTRIGGKRRELRFQRKTKFVVLAAKEDELNLNQFEQMELKFGGLFGEDPQLTLAKIRARREDPDVSFRDVEKVFDQKKRGKAVEIKELPFNVPDEKKKNNQSNSSLNGLHLYRPVPKGGFRFQHNPGPVAVPVWKLNQSVQKGVDKDDKSSVPNVILRKKPSMFVEDGVQNKPARSTPRIKPNLKLKMGNGESKEKFTDMTLLRKPEPVRLNKKPEDSAKGDHGVGMTTGRREGEDGYGGFKLPGTVKSDLKGASEIRNGTKQKELEEKFSDMSLLRKPEPMRLNKKPEDSENVEGKKGEYGAGMITGRREGEDGYGGFTLAKKPETVKSNLKEASGIGDGSKGEELKGELSDMLMRLNKKPEHLENVEVKKGGNSVEMINGRRGEDGYNGFTVMRKPETGKSDLKKASEAGDGSNRKEQVPEGDSLAAVMQLLTKPNFGMTGKETAVNEKQDIGDADSTAKYSVESALQGKLTRQDQFRIHPENYGNATEIDNLPSMSPEEAADWAEAKYLFKSGDRVEVEIISSDMRGFAVSFGSLAGFLPHRNLSPRLKFVAFETWLREKGLDPSMYRKELGIIERYDVMDKNSSLSSSIALKIDQNIVGDITPEMKLEDILSVYEQEKLKFLSSLVGKRVKVNVVKADRMLRSLIVSMRPKEKEESVERKRNLMAKLQIGDVVKCCITKITYIGIFVEVDGVPALIHQTEVSWDATLDPTSYFKVGEIVEAKVHQLDFKLDRIYLSLREIAKPDPHLDSLKSVIGDLDALDGRVQVAEPDTEWTDVESLIKELQQIEGIQSVSKGRFFLSPGLAPTFQVYMASMFANQYKLLARSGNKVQEVIVHASFNEEEMKSTILSCTNRVE